MSRPPWWRRPAVALLIDVLLVLVFAAVGRASHDESGPLLGALVTAWPFLVGTAVGWLVVRVVRRTWPIDVAPGVTVWFATVLVGIQPWWDIRNVDWDDLAQNLNGFYEERDQ